MARVLMFGALAELAGWRERVIDAGSLGVLRAMLAAEDAGLGERLAGPGTCAILNAEMVRRCCQSNGNLSKMRGVRAGQAGLIQRASPTQPGRPSVVFWTCLYW